MKNKNLPVPLKILRWTMSEKAATIFLIGFILITVVRLAFGF